jgi:radical SAM superfamily enzyme YgiQ (UPF0313 family)
VETITARRAYEISDEFRIRGVPVILGGMHPTLIPSEAAEHADAIFLGDAEFLWSQVIDDARRGKLRPVYRSDVGPPQPGTLTRRDLFRGKGYLPITLLQFSRGCRYACEFCAISRYFNQVQYRRRVREVIEEIEAQERRLLFFVDDNILSDQEAAKILCRELIPLKIHWVAQGSIDMTGDLELMRLMARSGCLGHVIGFETLDPENLRQVGKLANLQTFAQGYGPQIEIIRDFGLQIWASFTLGYDGDTADSIQRTLEFALAKKFSFAAFNILMPYPSTLFYESLAREGRLLYQGKWWLHPEYRFNHAAYRPRRMSPDALTEACYRARAEFNSISSIVKRAFDFKTNMRSPFRLGLYLRYNPLFRREVFKKQGMKLGEHQRGA